MSIMERNQSFNRNGIITTKIQLSYGAECFI